MTSPRTNPSRRKSCACAVIAHMRGAVTLQLLLLVLHSLGSTAHVRPHWMAGSRLLPRLRATCLAAHNDDGACVLPAMVQQEQRLSNRGSSFPSSKVDYLLVGIPVLLPLAAYWNYDDILKLVTWFIDLGPGDWLAVDGGKEQVARLQPAINGVVLPAISIALGTLSATTISSLRDRQIQLRACIHKEACLVDAVLSASTTVFAGRLRRGELHEALMLLSGYATRLIDESSLTSSSEFRALQYSGASDSELRSYLRLVHRSPPIRDAVDARGQPLAFHEGGLAGYAPSAHSSRGEPPVDDVVEPRFFGA